MKYWDNPFIWIAVGALAVIVVLIATGDININR